LEEFGKALSYESKIEEKNPNSYIVWHSISNQKTHKVIIANKLTCDCDFHDHFKLVCRHILHVCLRNGITNLEKLSISDRWHQKPGDEITHFNDLEF